MSTTITRKQLTEVAERALALTADHLDGDPAWGHDGPIPPDQRAAVMVVVRTAPHMSGDATWWRPAEGGNPEYGCLVGWILKEEYVGVDDPVYHSLGITYLRALDEVLGDNRSTTIIPVVS